MTWQVKPLGEICEFQRGLTYAKGDEVAESDNVVLRANNIDLATNHLDLSDLRHIRQEIAIPNAKRVRKGSLIICTASGSKSHLGKVALIDNDYGYAFGGFMGQITPKPGLSSKYLFHLMTSDLYKDFISGLSDGANINNLKFDDLGRFEVPFPCEKEQHRIVALLDQALSGIATANANAAKNLQNARELFNSKLALIFPGLKDRHILGEVCQTSAGGTPLSSKKAYYENGSIPWIMSGEVNRKEIVSATKFITQAGLENSSAKLFPEGTIVVAMYGATAGQVGILRIRAATNQAICGVLPNKSFLPEFVYFFFMARKDYLVSQATGNAQPNISQAKIRGLAVPCPSLAHQELIVAELDEVAAEVERLESLYTRKLAALDELKQSLLHQAFSKQL